MQSCEWVALSTLAPGTPFLAKGGRLGLLRHYQPMTASVSVCWANSPERVAETAPGDVEVLPLSPATLADDLAELALAREALADWKGENEVALRQERALERERCAAVCEHWGEGPEGTGVPAAVFERRHGRHANLASAIRSLGPAPAPERCDRLAAEVARLREALLGTQRRVRDGPCWCAPASAGPHCAPCAAAREALKAGEGAT